MKVYFSLLAVLFLTTSVKSNETGNDDLSTTALQQLEENILKDKNFLLCSSQKSEILSLQNQINQYKVELADLQAEIRAKDTTINEQDIKIKDLQASNAQIADLQAEINLKDAKINEQDEKIKDLEDSVAQIADLQAEIQAKDAKINEQDEKIRNLQASNAQVADLQAEIQTKNDLIHEQDEQIKDLQASVAQIADLQAEIQTKDAAIHEQAEKIKDLADSVAQIQSEIQSKDNQINEKDNEINELQSQIRVKDDQLALSTDKIKELEANISDCDEVSKASSCLGKPTDVYTIQVGDAEPFPVPCDSDVAGSGWTVIQRRVDGGENFYLNWTEYKAGFGNLRGDYFVGLERLNLLTQSQPHELYIHLEDFANQTRYARYSDFLIGYETEDYELKMIGNYTGTAGNAMKNHLNMKFSTPDRDNDKHVLNCAESYKSGWWFVDCLYCNLNGPYSKEAISRGARITWNTWKTESLKSVQMMIRPKVF